MRRLAQFPIWVVTTVLDWIMALGRVFANGFAAMQKPSADPWMMFLGIIAWGVGLAIVFSTDGFFGWLLGGFTALAGGYLIGDVLWHMRNKD